MKYYSVVLIVLLTACRSVQWSDVSSSSFDSIAIISDSIPTQQSIPVHSYHGGILYADSLVLDNWHSSHNNILIGKKKGEMVVLLRNVGVDYEMVFSRFRPLDMSSIDGIYVNARVLGSDTVRIRMDLKDSDGYVTNNNPQEHKILPSDTYKEYFFEFKNHWMQNWPTRHEVNTKQIVEMYFNFNGGGPNTEATILIKDIKVK
ncbi:MAG: hypothetical protein MUE33_01230 [Cytophagaceae bacterium]|jgi:hypothetical protein|nr:hypothetical protein [Cytophagaceae bacterium]